MARRTMSALDLAAWIAVSGRRLEGLRVYNIYQVGSSIALRLRANYGDALVLQPAVRAHLSARAQPGPEGSMTPLVRALRENVRDERIRSVRQVGFDRLLELEFYNGDRLVAELVPRGVLVLLSPEGRIIAASGYPTMKDRSIRRGQPYSYPPIRTENPFVLPAEELGSRLTNSRSPDLVRALVLALGVPGEAAEEAVFRAGLRPDVPPASIGPEDLRALSQAISSIASESIAGKGYLALSGGQPLQVTPFEPRSLEGKAEVRVFSLLDEALDEYFNVMASALSLSESKAKEEMMRAERSLREARAQAEQYEATASELEAQANALASNFDVASRALKCAKERGDGCEGVVEIDRKAGTAVIELGGIKARVYLYETVEDAIKRLYRQAGELRAKAERARAMEGQLEQRLAEIKREEELSVLRARVRARRKAWYERYHWLVTSTGILAIGGRDADQNESIVRKMLTDNDVFIHADIHGGSVVALLARGKEFSENDIAEAATLAAAYSKAWKAGMSSVPIYWSMGSQVSKSPPSGEYLTKGAFMVYGKKNYLKPVKLILALGVALDEEGLPLVIVGPEDLVAQQSLAYVILAPGDRGVEEVARKALELMAKAAEGKGDLVRALDTAQVARELPGTSTILAVRKGLGGQLRRPTWPQGI